VHREVAIIGIGLSEWGELWEKSLRDTYVEAALKAIDDAGIDRIDSMYVGCMSGGLFNDQEHLASLLSDYLGIAPVPAVRVESACASGGLALKMGIIEIMSGNADVILVGGVEKMTDVSGDQATAALASAADTDYEFHHGITFPGLYAMMARLHMERYGTTREQLAEVAVKNHFHGSMNPLAQYPSQITREMVMNSVMIADPLRIFDCSPITDGAAALVICPLDMAKKISKHPIVKIRGFGHATGPIALHGRTEMCALPAVTKAAEKAYQMADIKPDQLDLVEVHDCFTIAEICVLEAIGLVEKGKGGEATVSGMTRLGGKIPVNTSGGLKSKGHPVGATGVAQAIEIVTQLRGKAGKRQVEKARIGMTQNMGGSGGSSIVHIMEVL